MATDFTKTALGLVVLVDIELASGTLRYATEDTPLVGGNFYEGRVAGVQGITEELSTLLRPIQRQGTVTVILDNIQADATSGFFDSSIDGSSNFWPNTSVTIRAGEGLTFSEYSTVFQGRIRLKDGIKRTLDTLELVIEDRRARELSVPMPPTLFNTTTYPNLEDGGASRRIPLLYGDWSSVWVGPLTCTDTTVNEFKIADHAIFSIAQVGKDPGNGTGIANVSHTNENLTAATFRITAYDPETDRVYVKCEGKAGGGTLLMNPSDVLDDLLANVVGLGAGALDSLAFTQLDTDLADLAARWYITEERAAEYYISRLANEVGMDLRIADNLYTPTWFVPGFPGTAALYEEGVNIAAGSFELRVDPNQEYVNEIQYAYAYDPRTKNFSKSGVVTDSAAVTEAGATVARSVQFTIIADDTDAQTLAQRLLLLFAGPPEVVSFETPDFDAEVADLISVTAGTLSSLLANARKTMREFKRRLVRLSALTVRSAASIGRWVEDSHPVAASSTLQQMQQAGYWTLDNGTITGVPTFPGSKFF
ncbi:MAG: hypothetical protein HYY96_01200 [Candidatus Tectomicrobia bacterium]|nr:hypothetical protein [Candidatus Tectomicrobia bacterium]